MTNGNILQHTWDNIYYKLRVATKDALNNRVLLVSMVVHPLIMNIITEASYNPSIIPMNDPHVVHTINTGYGTLRVLVKDTIDPRYIILYSEWGTYVQHIPVNEDLLSVYVN